jgi:C4-dicarboxylate transporter DctM subunit
MTVALFVLFALFLILGVPIAFSLGLSSLGALLIGDGSLAVVASRLYSAADSFSLMAIPFFVLAGCIMEKGKLSRRLIDFAMELVGPLKGGLGYVTVVTSMFFSAISGSGPATTAAIGSITIPAMEENGYDKKFATALQATSGAMGPIIPPSIVFIQYGVATGTSIGALFIAGIVPGLLIGAALIIMNGIISHKKGYGGSNKKYSVIRIWKSFKNAALVILMPVIILGGIYGAIFTPTEAAIVACVYGLILACVIYRELSLKDIKDVFVSSCKTTSMIMLVITCASLFGWILSSERIPERIAASVLAVTSDKFTLLIAINILLLIVGCLLDQGSATIILAPILTPIAVAVGVDPIHFGALMVTNLCLGLVTPPVGVNLYVACGIAKLKIEDIVKPVLLLLGACLVMQMIITFVPDLIMFLPRLLKTS